MKGELKRILFLEKKDDENHMQREHRAERRIIQRQ